MGFSLVRLAIDQSSASAGGLMRVLQMAWNFYGLRFNLLTESVIRFLVLIISGAQSGVCEERTNLVLNENI